MKVALILLIASASLAGCSDPNEQARRIGSATYLFPAEARIFSGGVIFDSGENWEHRPSKSSINIQYNRNFDETYANKKLKYVPWWMHTNIPRVRGLLLGSDSKDLIVIRRPWGDVLCSRSSIKFGLFLACGSSFNEAGAHWQVMFHYDKLRQNSDAIAEARAALRRLRIEARPGVERS